MSKRIHEDNYESKARASPRGGVCKEAGDRVARRGTRRAEKARVPGTRWPHTPKSGEPRDRVNVALVQRPLTVLSGESCVASWDVAGHGN
jgi:hypothetical protein